MASMTITIPDAVAPEVFDAMAARGGWTPADGTKAAFAKAQVIAFIKSVHRQYKAQAAGQTAETEALAAADAAATIT